MEQQKPFHSSEVSLLVLRYLAGIKCTDTARCFFKELPGLREFLQSKNRGCETPRAFEGPEVLGSLEDILFDYGKAKMMVKKLVVRLMTEWRVLSEDDISPCDTLGTQLRQVSALLATTFSQPRSSGSGSSNSLLALPPPKSTRDIETQTSDLIAVIRTKRVASTCTTLDIPEGQNIVVTNVKIMLEEEVQTDVSIPKEAEAQYGIGVEEFIKTVTCPDVPIEMAFRDNLLRNTDFQQTIANSINDARGGGVEEFIKTVSGKAENEIDNFLADLLQADERTHGGYSWNPVSMDFGGNSDEIPDIHLVNLADNDPSPTFQVQNNSSQSQLNTPGKVIVSEPSAVMNETPIPIASTSAGPSSEEVKLNSKPVSSYKSPRNCRKTKPPVHPRTNKDTITLSPGKISAWQMLGRRNIVPRIPVSKVSPPPPPPPPPISTGKTITNCIWGNEEVVRGVESCPESPSISPPADELNQTQAPSQVAIMEPQSQSQPIEPQLQKTDVRIESIKKLEGRTEVQVSPMLQQLMASAQKFRQASNVGLTKSSFSTPRKKTHVRNLIFTTPPSCSAISKTANISTEEMSNKFDQNLTRSVPVGKDRKRKADQISLDPLKKSPNPVPKSRKRLDWADEQASGFQQESTIGVPVVPMSVNEPRKPSPPLQKPSASRRSNRNTTAVNNGYSASIENVVQSSHYESNLRSGETEKVHRVEAKSSRTTKSDRMIEPPKTLDPPRPTELPKKPDPPRPTEHFKKSDPPPRTSEYSKKSDPPRNSENSRKSDHLRTLERPKQSDTLRTLEYSKKSDPLRTSEYSKKSDPPRTSEYSKKSDHPRNPTAQYSKKSDPPKTSEPLKTTEVSKTSKSSRISEPRKSKPSSTPEPPKTSKPPKKSEHSHTSESSKISKPLTTSEPPKISKPPKTSEPSKTSQTLKASKPPTNPEPPKTSKPPERSPSLPYPPLPPPPLPKRSPSLPYPPLTPPPLPKRSPSLPYPPPLPPLPQGSPSLPPPLPPLPDGSPSLPPPPPPMPQRSPSLPPPPPPLPQRSPSLLQRSSLPPPPPPPLPLSLPAQESSVCVPTPPLPTDETASPLPPMPESSPLQATSFSQTSLVPSLAASSQSQFAVPAVTPVKIVAPSEQSMELPATPSTDRFLNSFGNSWDSSDGKITLHYENNGIYPTNLLLSTPIRDGLPKTPGRFSPTPDGKSLSSCSSIFETPDVVAFKDQYQPFMDELNTPIPKNSAYIPPTPEILGKNGGSFNVGTDSQDENCTVTSMSQEIPKQSESSSLCPVSEKSSSQRQSQSEGIDFNVGGRRKTLTLSEQQTLFCLLEMKKGVGSPSPKVPLNGSDPATSDPVDKDVMLKLRSLKNVNLDTFLTIVHGDRN